MSSLSRPILQGAGSILERNAGGAARIEVVAPAGLESAYENAEFMDESDAICGEPEEEKAEVELLPPVILRMPNAAFGMAMGLAGHAIMWKTMQDAVFLDNKPYFTLEMSLNLLFWCLSASVGGLVAVCYLYKVLTSFPLVLAEDKDETRCHFFNAPNLIYIMLLIGLPDQISVTKQTLRILGFFAFVYQIVMTQHIYKGWFFSSSRNFERAKPQFLLSTVGWFLLSVLGQKAQVKEAWGIGFPQMCLGAGFMLYIDVVIFIFSKLHTNPELKGQPAMFLLIAPPSVGVVALDMNDGDDSYFNPIAEMWLGWVYVVLMLLVRLGPKIAREPAVLGEYWAYVFPLAAAATATIRYASALDTAAAQGLAYAMIALAFVSLLVVAGRSLFHSYECSRRGKNWEDGVYKKERYSTRRLSSYLPSRVPGS